MRKVRGLEVVLVTCARLAQKLLPLAIVGTVLAICLIAYAIARYLRSQP